MVLPFTEPPLKRGGNAIPFDFDTITAGLSMTHVEATYLAWIDTRQAKLEDPARFFEAAGAGLSDGAEFGGPGFVRLNFGCPRPLLAEALHRMERATNGR